MRGADFSLYYGSGGITVAQLSSTASYLSHDLSGIGLGGINLTGANLAGQNLTNASLNSANLSVANLSQANLTGAHVEYANFNSTGITLGQLYSTASYLAHNLSGIGLAGSDRMPSGDTGKVPATSTKSLPRAMASR